MLNVFMISIYLNMFISVNEVLIVMFIPLFVIQYIALIIGHYCYCLFISLCNMLISIVSTL